MSTQQITPDKLALPMSGKYDRRGKHGNQRANSGSFVAEGKSGPKPKKRTDLAGRRAVTELRRMDQHKKPSEMFQEALEARNYALAWTIRCDVETRALGRPYVAINPDEQRHDQADISRIAVAINNLQIVNNPKSESGRANQLAQSGEQGSNASIESTGYGDNVSGDRTHVTSPADVPEPIQAGAKATPVR